MRRNYETTMSEWLAVEAIVRQHDKEIMAANLAKLSSEGSTDIPLVGKDPSLSSEVGVDQLAFATQICYNVMLYLLLMHIESFSGAC